MALVNERARLLENERLAAGLYLMRLESPLIARDVGPGQFVHMRIPGMEGHVLRRPFSVYSRDASAGTLDVLYQVVGFGTRHLAGLAPGARCELVGPVGAGWALPEGCSHALLVGGGVGAAPLFMFCERLAGAGVRACAVLGAQTRDALVCEGRYREVLGEAVRCATDDGSYGFAGFCTDLAKQEMARAAAAGDPYDFVAACGPEPVMRIVSGAAAEAGVACQVSMERRMACGVGACLSCVVDTVDGKRRACVDGPVFDAGKVVWQ